MTNETIENIITRRSMRAYEDKPIPEEALNAILRAAIYAPTGSGSQLWRFTAVKNKEILLKLNELVRGCFARLEIDENTYIAKVKGKKNSLNPDYSFYYKAPVLVIVSAERSYSNAMADCAAAEQDILLAAHSLGFGSCWINQLTWFCDEPEVRAELNTLGIPQSHKVCASAAIGYGAVREPGPPKRKEDVIKIIN